MKASQETGRLAYLTTAYPHVSHTFIRREILELERLGYDVVRVAVRPGGAVVDARDIAEQGRTLVLLQRSLFWLTGHALRGGALGIWRLPRAFGLLWTLHKASERGLLRHIAYLAEALILRSFFAAAGVSHVHVHFGTNATAVAMLVKLLGGPGFSVTMHGPDEFDAAIGLSLGRKIAEARFVVAISHYGASQLRRWSAYADWKKLQVVRCTVEPEWFESGRPVSDDAADIVCIGRLSGQKGQLLLIDAMARAVERGFRGKLILVGDGEMRSTVESKIAENKLGNRVTITGWCDSAAIRNYLAEARALVLPSFAEGLPVVIMEAMAMQRPVLTTCITGIPELVRNREHGWLVTAGDEDGLVDALLELDDTPAADLRRMGEAGRQAVAGQHSVSVEVAKLAGLFAELGGVRPGCDEIHGRNALVDG